MEKLVQGVQEFQDNVFHDHRELFEELAGGQKPTTLFITCSDSRIDPCLMTQTKPGELFILRNAGNIVPPYESLQGGEAATIEYAVKHLPIADIVVCGHSSCGAMTGLLALDQLDSLPSVKAWLAYAKEALRIVEQQHSDKSGADLLNEAIKANVLVQLDNLRTHPSVAEAEASGRVELHGWVYRFETGDVFAHETETGNFVTVKPHDELF